MPPQAAGRGAKVGCIHIQVLMSGIVDAPLLIIDVRARRLGYLINCGEGIQRFCVEHKMRLVGKLQRFINAAGLGRGRRFAGMLFTMARRPQGHCQIARAVAASAAREQLPRLCAPRGVAAGRDRDA